MIKVIEFKFYLEEKRCVAFDNHEEIGESCYVENGDTWNIIHTFVKSEYQGQGIARKLVECIKEKAIHNNKLLIADCTYAKKIISR